MPKAGRTGSARGRPESAAWLWSRARYASERSPRAPYAAQTLAGSAGVPCSHASAVSLPLALRVCRCAGCRRSPASLRRVRTPETPSARTLGRGDPTVETLATVAYRPVRPRYGDDLQVMRSLRSTDPAHLRLHAESRWDVDVLHLLVVLDGHPNPNPPSCRKGRGDTSPYLKWACQQSRERVATRKTVPTRGAGVDDPVDLAAGLGRAAAAVQGARAADSAGRGKGLHS
jgi:hypothetical protein